MPLLNELLSKNRQNLHNFVGFPGQYIYQNDRRNTAYNRICSKQMDVTMSKLLIKAMLLAFGACGAVFPPIYSSFAMGVKTTTIEAKLPFINDKSMTEFYINCALELIVFFHGTLIYLGSECTTTIFENFTAVSTKLIENELLEIDSDNSEPREMSKLQLRSLFRNILLQARDFDRCVRAVRFGVRFN